MFYCTLVVSMSLHKYCGQYENSSVYRIPATCSLMQPLLTNIPTFILRITTLRRSIELHVPNVSYEHALRARWHKQGSALWLCLPQRWPLFSHVGHEMQNYFFSSSSTGATVSDEPCDPFYSCSQMATML